MYNGVFEFYRDRITACPRYGFKAGHDILFIVLRTAFWDSFLTQDEFITIMNLCDDMHKKLMEENYNAGWNKQNP